MEPNYAPNVENQTVDYGGKTWKGNPGSGWTAADSGGGGYDDLLKSIPKATDYANTINTGVNKSFDEYLNTVKSAPTSLDSYTKNLESSGIPQLQKTQSTLQGQIYDLEDTLRRVEPNVAATTRNSVVTEGQRRGMVEARQKPLVENLGWLGQSLGRVSSAVSEGKSNALTLTGLGQQDSQRVLDAYKQKLDVAISQGAQSLQAFIHDSDNILNVSLAKIQRGEQVSDQEAQNAFSLLQMQKQAELASQKTGTDTQMVDLGGRKVLIDSQTGKEINSYNEVKAAGSGAAAGGFNFSGFQEWFNKSKQPQRSTPVPSYFQADR